MQGEQGVQFKACCIRGVQGAGTPKSQGHNPTARKRPTTPKGYTTNQVEGRGLL